MSSFRTELKIPPYPYSINHQTPILCLGSCFAENMGHRLHSLKFPILINPFGILYNPISIQQNLQRVLNREPWSEEDLFRHQELWHSFDHHGRLSDTDRSKALANLQSSFEKTTLFLKKCRYLVITLGTAYVFELKKAGKIVANCHKIPVTQFNRRLLGFPEIIEAWSGLLRQLNQTYPNLQVILTVSPVRHLRDGLLNNSLSKAVLRVATETLVRSFDFVRYFPAYELIMDDLRDYRFYEADLTHPNEMAQSYIWEKFQHAFFDNNTGELVKRLDKLGLAKDHKPFHPEGHAHQEFIQKQLKLTKELENQYPFLNFEPDRKHWENRLLTSGK